MRGSQLVFRLTLVLILSSLSAFAVNAAHHVHGRACPNCNAACYPTVKETKEKKHCWNVECKTICIPPVTFSWQLPGSCQKRLVKPLKRGWSKKVRVLAKHEYECTKCKYEWSVSEGACSSPPSDCACNSCASHVQSTPEKRGIAATPPREQVRATTPVEAHATWTQPLVTTPYPAVRQTGEVSGAVKFVPTNSEFQRVGHHPPSPR